MNVKFQGFQFHLAGSGISWDDFLSFLLGQSGEPFSFLSFDRIICIDRSANSDYILGLFVSIKNQRRFCEIRDSGGSFTLKSRELEAGSSIADFNFFILNKRTHAGLYQYYHQSCSLRQFIRCLEGRYYSLKKMLMRDLNSQMSIEGRSNHIAARIQVLRESALNGQVLLRPGTFNDLLAGLSEIKEVSFNIATDRPEVTWFTSIQRSAKRRTERILFHPGGLPEKISGIASLASMDGIDALRVCGTSAETGMEWTIRTLDNVEDFGQFDYDELTQHLNVQLNDFVSSEVLNLLIRAASEYSTTLERTNE